MTKLPQVKLLLRGSYIDFKGNNEVDSLVWFVDTSDNLTPENGKRFLDCDSDKKNCRLAQVQKQGSGAAALYASCIGLAALCLVLSACLGRLSRLARKALPAPETTGLLDSAQAGASAPGLHLETAASN